MKIKRLTTDTPKNNSERLMNFAYSKDGEIYVLWHNGVKDVNINDIVRKLADYGDYSNILDGVEDDDIFETLIENGQGLWATTMLMLATQAAELRDRLKTYEDTEEKELLKIFPCKIGDPVWWIADQNDDGEEIPTVKKDETPIRGIFLAENGKTYVCTVSSEKDLFSTDCIAPLLTEINTRFAYLSEDIANAALKNGKDGGGNE